ncbi:MAG TPA: GNAT family protein, partial [Beutenbergiaceae bacterium]|nr:GNAT family protein [Beutenbergiaceae bacterium]
IRPENSASLRVVEKLGFREEGVREKYIFIDGAWRDHRSFALVTEETSSLVDKVWPA